MAMEKYGVDQAKVQELLRLHLAAKEADALHLVASGEADGLIKEAHARLANKAQGSVTKTSGSDNDE